jgi:[ribosomal protein S5]-alanine N-acetyltransferase
MCRLVSLEDRFQGARVTLRLVTLDDCSERYVEWLEDPEVNRYLETRWSRHTLDSVRSFVSEKLSSLDSYLFAILERANQAHVGNIKIGPIHPRHAFADVSYFIGDRASWGRGLATDAIKVVTRIGFERLGLHRVQAGLYAGNVGSRRALEKAGYVFEGCLKGQLRTADAWEDHVCYGLLQDAWERLPPNAGGR